MDQSYSHQYAGIFQFRVCIPQVYSPMMRNWWVVNGPGSLRWRWHLSVSIPPPLVWFFGFLFVFGKIWLCILDWPQTWNPPASDCQVLGITVKCNHNHIQLLCCVVCGICGLTQNSCLYSARWWGRKPNRFALFCWFTYFHSAGDGSRVLWT